MSTLQTAPQQTQNQTQLKGVKAYAAPEAKALIAPFQIDRRDPKPYDVVIDIEYCGVCHSDIHQVRDEWGGSIFPMVPGHEIVGRVTQVGSDVSKYHVGDLVGVGCMIDSCRECEPCKEGLQQFCEKGMNATYNGQEKDGSPTYGGYSQAIVVDENYVLKVPENLDRKGVAPLLCAGITTYSPLRHWNVQKGQKVGVIGLGGLGHMAVKFAHSMGAETVVFTTSEKKKDDAKRLGADSVIISKNEEDMKSQAGTFDFILDTVSAKHDVNALLEMLKKDGHLVVVGVPEEADTIQPFNLISKRRSIGGSLIGGIPETQEMLDYCGEHNITSDVEVIPIEKINEAYERMVKGDVHYRFVIDSKSLS